MTDPPSRHLPAHWLAGIEVCANPCEHEPVNDVGFLLVWLMACAGFTLYGLLALRDSQGEVDRFKRLGTTFFGEKLANRVYTKEGVRVAALCFVIVGPIFLAIGTTLLIVSL